MAQPCVFVKQLPGPILCAPPCDGDPLSRSYRVNLPSSLTANLSSALVYSTRLRVSVYGTGIVDICLADFLGSLFTVVIRLPEGARYCQVRLFGWICLPESSPTLFNQLFRQLADVSLLRLRITLYDSNGILTVSSIGCAVRLLLRARLTLIRLALIRMP